jgi:hypothetical protein
MVDTFAKLQVEQEGVEWARPPSRSNIDRGTARRPNRQKTANPFFGRLFYLNPCRSAESMRIPVNVISHSG